MTSPQDRHPSFHYTPSPSYSVDSRNLSIELFAQDGIVTDLVAEDERSSNRSRWFPQGHILEVSLSEPRDVLQSERTFLTFIRFSLSLYFTAIGMTLGFRLRSVGEPSNDRDLPKFNTTVFNHIVSFILIFLAFATLVVAGTNYFRTVRRYSQRRIHSYGTNNTVMVVCITAVVVTLVAVNISLIVERYLQDR